MNKGARKNLFLILIAGISIIVTFLNLGWDKSFIGEDMGVNLQFPDININRILYAWDDYTAPGKLNVSSFISFLWWIFIYLLFKLGINAFILERLVYFLFFFVSGISSFDLSILLFRIYHPDVEKRVTYTFSFAGCLLYMFNHFAMSITSFTLGPYHISYMLFPLVFALLIQNLHYGFNFKRIFFLVITFILLTNGNLGNTISLSLFLIFYFLFFIFIEKVLPFRFSLFIPTFIILFFLFSSYIYLPIFSVGSDLYYHSAIPREYSVSYDSNSKQTSFLNLFRLAGQNIWPNYPHYHLYTQNIIFILLGYLIPLCIFISLFLFPKGKRIKLFFGIIIIFALFFSKGTHSPFPKLFLWVVSKIPYFEIYRAVYYKFTFYIVISYAILMGFFMSEFFPMLKKHKVTYLTFLIPSIILIYNLPFFTGKVIYKDCLSKIPQEYYNLKNLSDTITNDVKIISLPPTVDGDGPILVWGERNLYIGPFIDALFFNRPVMDSYWFIAYKILPGTSWGDDLSFEENVGSIMNYTKLLNTRYLFLHKDFVDKYDFGAGGGFHILKGKLRTEIIKSILDEKNIEIKKDGNYYTLYRLSDEYFLPHFYPSTYTTVVTGDIKSLVLMTETKYLDGKMVLLFTQQNQKVNIKNQNFNNFVFKDSNWQDLAVKLSAQSTVFSSQSTVRLEKIGIYEIYLDVSEFKEEENPELDIKIDGKEIVKLYGVYSMEYEGRRYIKVGEVELEEGKHKINIKYQNAKIKMREQNLKFILVNKKEREDTERLIWERMNEQGVEVAYILSKDGEFLVK